MARAKRARIDRKANSKWFRDGGRRSIALHPPGLEVHSLLIKEIEARKLQLDPREVAGIEISALVRTLKAYKSGLLDILTRRYAKRRSYFDRFVHIKNPSGAKALYVYKTKGLQYDNIAFGRIRVKGPKKVSLAEWNPHKEENGLGFEIIRGQKHVLKKGFIVHGFREV